MPCCSCCSAAAPPQREAPGSLPYKYWRLGFLVPDHMEVWVETADVEDIHGNLFYRAGEGTVSVHLPTAGTGNAVGWRKTWGRGRHVNGADLPRRIYVRWQSLAEPQTYRVILEIPERARQLMSERLDPPCRTSEYRHALALGLAPRRRDQRLGHEHLRRPHRGAARPGGNRTQGTVTRQD